MLRLATVILVGATALAGAAPSGRVVRVERGNGLTAVPMYCEIQPTTKGGLCIGTPAAGERVALIDQERAVVVGEFRIDTVGPPGAPFDCPGSAQDVYKITGTVVAGEPAVIAEVERLAGLRNLRLDPRARLEKDRPAPDAIHTAQLAIDLTGNGSVDYMLVRYECDQNGNPGNAHNRVCFDSYLERGGRLERTQQHLIKLCY
ncbi:MAG: hypothetical protein H0T89_10355 [Deltaproteobacteria bacterium]|nr:hypothetical protein [Deltaproteobacteria bacterium]MDQ3296349.1 hypothetical protein [Myxococcota bacterium]